MRRLMTFALAAVVMAATPAFAQKPGGTRRAAPQPQAAPMAPIRYHAVLAAGDASLPVWDNAVQRFLAGLQAAGTLAGTPQRLSAGGKQSGTPVASTDNILRAVAGLQPGPGEGCLVFATSHGAPRAGLVMTPSPQQPLSPAALNAALSRGGCADAPTIVVVSGCYSGDFATVLARPNRIVVTAARNDRPSFGCGAGYQYTVFDECLLDAMDQHQTLWTQTLGTTRACVIRRERELNANPSEPQLSVGAAVAGLRSPTGR